MKELVYRGELIHVFPNGSIFAYTMNADGDIDETPCKSVEHAKQVIDEHIQYMIEEGFACAEDYE